MILIDLQKVFDTTNHRILLDKLVFLGFSNSAISWFKSYLSNRSFIVNVKNDHSDPGDIRTTPFSLYINDIPSAIKCELLLHADDSVLLFTHNNIIIINDLLNREFNVDSLWIITILSTLEKTRRSQFCSLVKINIYI